MVRRRQTLPPSPGWAIYLRTSTLEAQNPTMSQERQRFNINRALLEHSDLRLVGEYADVMSGRTPKRDGYQRLLSDARAGKFSHVAVENAERFGRNDTEALIAIDELHELGIAIRFADYPDLDPIDADDRLMITISFTLARRESIKLGERVRGGLHAKLRSGGSPTIAPDGYLNMEEKIDNASRSRVGRYTRWIEPDPEQFKVWRLAWDLLLTDKYTFAEICEELHTRGYRYRSGRPFVEIEKGRRKPVTNTLSKRFSNWFYAGWVVSEKAGIPPKTIRGNWTPLVTTEEFEQGLEILQRRSRHRVAKRKFIYLLKGMIYLAGDKANQLTRLTGSTSNSSRKSGGTAYYCVWSSNVNIRCELIDEQVAQAMSRIQVDPELLPAIREAYTKELAEKLGHLRPNEEELLTSTLKALEEEETRAARLYAAGKITDAVWDIVWEEWQDKRRTIQQSLESVNRQQEAHIENLDVALTIIAKVGILYNNLERSSQRELLREMVEKVVVDREGHVLRVDLLPPFAYLQQVINRVRGETSSEGSQKTKNGTSAVAEQNCSDCTSGGGPEEIRTNRLLLHLSFNWRFISSLICSETLRNCPMCPLLLISRTIQYLAVLCTCDVLDFHSTRMSCSVEGSKQSCRTHIESLRIL